MTSASKLAAQGNQLRQLQSTTPLLAILAKAIGNLHETGPDAPPFTRDQWMSEINDIQFIAESDLMAFITDQVVRTFTVNGAPGLNVPVSEAVVSPSIATLTASRNVSASDAGQTLYYAGSTNITLTIPSGLPSAFGFNVIQAGSGKVTLAASGGMTVSGKNNHLSTGGAWHVIHCVRATSTQYVVYGDTAA
jgi:hypothetical protein